VPQARDQRRDLLQVAVEVRGMDVSDVRRLKALEEDEPQTEEAVGLVDARRGHPERDAQKKTSDAQGTETGRELGDQGEDLFAAACLRVLGAQGLEPWIH
jgi:hypothetical protein